jgi:putative salt-induced outer membrane protein
MSVYVHRAGLLVAALVPASPLLAEPVPKAIQAMLEAAGEDPAKLAVIAEVAKQTHPEAAGEIDAQVVALNKARTQAREARLAEQRFFDGWSGQGEAGGFTSSGNTNVTGISLGLGLTKTTRKAVHNLRGQFDWQKDRGVVTRERVLASYEGNFNLTPRLYNLTTLSYERDRFSGFNSRYAGSLGLGYRLFTGPRLKLALEAGPAIRQTAFTDGTDETSVAARGGLTARWELTPSIVLTENASIFYESFNTSFASLTALTARINGALSARLSLQVNAESNPPAGRKTSDTTSRATIVYSF